MPQYLEPSPGPDIIVRASLAVEIDWVLFSAHGRGGKGSPHVEEVYRRNPELAQRVTGLWGKEETLSYPGYLELSVLAERAGVLFSTETEDVLPALEAAARAGGPELPFLTETAGDRVVLQRRLDLLRASASRRRRYFAVVSEAWSAVRPHWEAEGHRAVEAAIADVAAQLGRGRSWEELVTVHCAAAASAVGLHGAHGRVAIVPAWFTHEGMSLDIGNLLVIGIRAETDAESSRSRTRALSRRLKVLADPTRLALVDALARQPMTVTELASYFALAQPTVSNHVRALREADILSEARTGTRRCLAVDRGALETVLEDLRRLVDPSD